MLRLARPAFLCKNVFRSYSTSSGQSLVILEHDNAKIIPGSLSAVTAAKQLGGSVSVLIFTESSSNPIIEKASKIQGIDRVVCLTNTDFVANKLVPEPVVAGLQSYLQGKQYSHLVFPHSAFGRSIMPRLAAKLDVSPVSDVIAVKSQDTFVRPIYAGNALCTVQSTDNTKLLSIRGTAFDKAPEAGTKAPVDVVESKVDVKSSKWVSAQVSKSERPDLQTARVVVSGGRGLQNGENFKMLEELADKLKGAVGASRAAVDAGFVPNDYQIGQTGKVIAPELYIAVGISGAIQHLAGMKDSKTIVAINKDAEAPIFQVADYGLVDDLFKVVPELTKQLDK